MALAEHGRGVAVQLQRQGDGRFGVGPQRVLARRRGGGLGDVAHADGMVIAAGHQGLARRRTERRGVKAIVLETAGGQFVERRRLARPAKGARRAKADIVQQDDQHVGRTLRRSQRFDRRKLGIRILGIVRGQPRFGYIRDGQLGSQMFVRLVGHGQSPKLCEVNK